MHGGVPSMYRDLPTSQHGCIWMLSMLSPVILTHAHFLLSRSSPLAPHVWPPTLFRFSRLSTITYALHSDDVATHRPLCPTHRQLCPTHLPLCPTHRPLCPRAHPMNPPSLHDPMTHRMSHPARPYDAPHASTPHVCMHPPPCRPTCSPRASCGSTRYDTHMTYPYIHDHPPFFSRRRP